MSATLINHTVAAGWVELLAPLSVQLNLQVSNAAILCQTGEGGAGRDHVYLDPEEAFMPGPASLHRRFNAVRVRALNPSAPAQVSIAALTAQEVGNGA